MKLDDFFGNGQVSRLLAATEPGAGREPAIQRELHAAVDAIARQAARTDEERALVERIAGRGEIRANERGEFFALLRRGADTEDLKELVRRDAKARWYLPAAPPEPAPNVALERQIAAVAAEVSADELLGDRALDDVVGFQRALARANAPDKYAVVRDQLQAAEEAYRKARTQLESAIGRLSTLQRAREDQRRDAQLQQTTGRAT